MRVTVLVTVLTVISLLTPELSAFGSTNIRRNLSVLHTLPKASQRTLVIMASSPTSPSEWQPLYLSCIAGASTCIGAAVVFIQPKHGNKRVVLPGTMAFSLALAGSVMVTVSAISIIPECLQDDSFGDEAFHMIPFWSQTMFYRVAFFLLGGALYFFLSLLLNVPEPEELLQDVLLVGGSRKSRDLSQKNSSLDIDTEQQPFLTEDGEDRIHLERSPDKGQTSPVSRMKKQESKEIAQPHSPGNNNGKIKASNCSNVGFTAWSTGQDLQSKDQQKAWRLAMLLFVSLLVHNFPEGLAVAASALESTNLGVTVTIGIMIHNIPEGIAIAIPCLAARPDKPWLAFVLASVSGLAEPLGAFVALMLMKGVEKSPDAIISLENILAFVAGIMVVVSMWELFPEALRHAVDTKKFFWYGTISGIVIMVLTELYLP